MTAAINAVPNPPIIKLLPIRPCAIINVIAFITKRNSPSERTVIGKVRITRIGFIMTFKIDRIKLANTAAPNPSNWNESNNSDTTIKATAFNTIDNIQRINIVTSPFSLE